MVDVKRRPGRPAIARAAPKNRLRELREKMGLTQAQLGLAAGFSQQQIGNLERDDRRMTFDYARRLAPPLDADPADLMPNMRTSLALCLAIAMADSDLRPPSFDLPVPQQRIQAPQRLPDPEDCFAVEVLDNSADLLYPTGSSLVIRRLDALDEPLRPGAKVVVRRFVGTRAEGQTAEVLVGLLDRSITGDLVLLTRSQSPRVPPSVPIQRSPAPSRGLAERQAVYRHPDERIDYQPRPEDPGEILGRVVFAITPE